MHRYIYIHDVKQTKNKLRNSGAIKLLKKNIMIDQTQNPLVLELDDRECLELHDGVE